MTNRSLRRRRTPTHTDTRNDTQPITQFESKSEAGEQGLAHALCVRKEPDAREHDTELGVLRPVLATAGARRRGHLGGSAREGHRLHEATRARAFAHHATGHTHSHTLSLSLTHTHTHTRARASCTSGGPAPLLLLLPEVARRADSARHAVGRGAIARDPGCVECARLAVGAHVGASIKRLCHVFVFVCLSWNR